MKQLVRVLYQKILEEVQPGQSNIVRLEGIDHPIIYQELCKKLLARPSIEQFIPKLAREKYAEFLKAGRAEWGHALAFLHQGGNSSFSSDLTEQYAAASYVDFNNAMTKWRNESANYADGKTTLILLMGTEAAQDTGGLADTSFMISPAEIIKDLSKDYGAWFDEIFEANNLREEDRKAIHTIYKTLFSQISTDIFKLSDFIDDLAGLSFSSVQELVGHICETLHTTWGIPSVIDKKAVPKVSSLKKGTLSSAEIIKSAVRFIERSDDIPTSSALNKLHQKFEAYADGKNINRSDPFPEERPLFSDYGEFEKTVLDFMQGIDLELNRKKLLQVDFAILSEIIGTKLPKQARETSKTYSGSPVEVYSRIFLNAAESFYRFSGQFPTKLQVRLERVTLPDCTDEQMEESFSNLCNFIGGILDFFNDLTIEIDGELLAFEYNNPGCGDPFRSENYSVIHGLLHSSGKWGAPFKIQFIITASNEEKSHKYAYKWAFSPYAPWLNAFSYLASVFHAASRSYILPTLVACQNMQDYLDCESEDEFYAHLQQFRGLVFFDEHKSVIRQFFNASINGQFDLVCNHFKNFAEELTQNGFFHACNELRILVKSYTDLMQTLHDSYASFTDVQKEKLSLLINLFTISSNEEVVQNGDMGEVIVPAYHPIMLEKLDAQQLFLRRGFEEILRNLISGEYTDAVLKSKFDHIIQLSSITQASDSIWKRADEYLICKNMWEYFGVYYGRNAGSDFLSSNAADLSIVTDDDDASAMLRSTPMSKIIVRNVMDYLRTFPARIDGLNVAFIAPADMQHIVAAIHTIAKSLDDEEYSATINLKIICINSKKNSAMYLRRWLDSYFSDEKSVKVNTFLHNSTIHTKSDVEDFRNLLENYDLCFTYQILQSSGIQFDLSTDKAFDMNYEKFPMSFTPDTISASHGKARRVNISQFQFLAAKEHTQASHLAGYPHSVDGVYRVYRTLELLDIQEAMIDIAHTCCKWVVCVDQAIDRHMLETEKSKIIGFTTGEGSYGELNVTVSARKDILADIKRMLRRRMTEKFPNWDAERLQKATNFCVDELSQYMDGSRILKALNPYDYEIHNFLAYILTLQILGLTRQNHDFIVRALISLDSYKHWFAEDDELSSDNKRPDFLLIEIPFLPENITRGCKLKIRAKMIECKMGFQNENHIVKATAQLEKGLRTLAMNWRPDAGGVMHRYWLNQLYRAIIFSPLNLDNTSDVYGIVRDKIYGILDGQYEIEWTGNIFAFWLNVNEETPQEEPIDSTLQSALGAYKISLDSMVCYSFGQMFIQKMLLPEEDRGSQFTYNVIVSPEEDNLSDEEDLGKEAVPGTGETIPPAKAIHVPFLRFLSDSLDHTRQEALTWFSSYFSISESDKKVIYQNNDHLKWETVLDFVISNFRKNRLLETVSIGTFRITPLGNEVAEMVNHGSDAADLFALAEAVEHNTFHQAPVTDAVQDSEPLPLDEMAPHLDAEPALSDTFDAQEGLAIPKVSPSAPDAEPAPALESPSDNGRNPLEKIRVLIGRDKKNLPVYWEFGHPKLANRHILITGTSGQGKTYAIQTMILELARQNISSVVFDYTDGFLPGKLEPEFERELGDKITQEVAILNRIPVNPFRIQTIEIPSVGSVEEKSTMVAGRISDILKHVYTFGDQQAASVYAACKQGVDQFGLGMDFSKLRQLLDDMGTSQSKSVLSKMAQFFDMDLFDSSREFNWQDVTQGDGKVTIIQLTGLDRELQTIVTEIMIWDAWYSLTKFGNKDTPFVVVLDEAQNLSFKEKSPAEKILREGRKYGWSAWFATQFLKGALDSGEISNLQQAAERLYFKPTGEEMSYISDQIADNKAEATEWLNVIKGIQKGQCVVQGDRLKPNGQFGAARPTLVSVSSFAERQEHFNG